MAFLSDVIRLVANLCSYAWPAWPIKMTIVHRLLIALKRLMEHIDVDVSINLCKKSFWCGFGRKIFRELVFQENLYSTLLNLSKWIIYSEESFAYCQILLLEECRGSIFIFSLSLPLVLPLNIKRELSFANHSLVFVLKHFQFRFGLPEINRARALMFLFSFDLSFSNFTKI